MLLIVGLEGVNLAGGVGGEHEGDGGVEDAGRGLDGAGVGGVAIGSDDLGIGRCGAEDLLLALELGRASDVPLLSVALSNEMLTAARAMGLANEDFAVMFDVLARISGLETR